MRPLGSTLAERRKTGLRSGVSVDTLTGPYKFLSEREFLQLRGIAEILRLNSLLPEPEKEIIMQI